MFSITPIRRMFVFCAIWAARTATSWASGCGVVTTSTSARGQQLPERDRDVAGSGRHVDEQHVELAPVHVGEELLERLVQHRAAPHDRRVVVEEEADRHQLQLVADRRDDHLVDEHGLLVDAEHVRDRVAVDVGVEDPGLWPSRARAAARFTVSDDLPTPPLPLATASTRVDASSESPSCAP